MEMVYRKKERHFFTAFRKVICDVQSTIKKAEDSY